MKIPTVKLLALCVAGLIGVGYSQCYWQVQAVCVSNNTVVDNITFPAHSNNALDPWGTAQIKANGNWTHANWTTTSQGGYGRQSLTQQEVCYGPAKFVNPRTGANETISWWKAGTKDTSLQQSFRWQTVDLTSPTC